MLLDWARLAGVLSRSRDLHAAPDPRCRVERNVATVTEWAADRFLPKTPSGVACLLVHGWTLRGKDDLRLQALARALAIAGVECLVPTVPGLAALSWEAADVTGIRALLEAERVPPALVGFSFGGGYSVLAASGCAKPPRFVVSVSGHADLSALFRYWETWGAKAPHGAEARKSWIYQKLALAWRQRDALAIPETRQAQLREILLSFCDEGSADAAWSFYEQALRTTNWEAENRLRQEPAVLRALSPAAHPLRLGCPVVILHDKTDQAVPASEAKIMAEAIARGSPTISVDILVTDLLRHVSLGPAFRLGEVVRLFRLLSPLVRG